MIWGLIFDFLTSFNFFAEIAHAIHANQSMSTKESSKFFSFALDLELFAENKKDMVSTNSKKPGFLRFYQ